jgi:hypothetical protein
MRTTDSHNDSEPQIGGIPETDLKRNAFNVPDGYFDGLTPRIMEGVRASQVIQVPPVFNWNRLLVPTFGFAILVLGTWFFLKPTESAELDFNATLASLTVEELTEYADLQPTELVSYDLVDYNRDDLSENSLSEEEIIEYLDSEDELNTTIDEIEL